MCCIHTLTFYLASKLETWCDIYAVLAEGSSWERYHLSEWITSSPSLMPHTQWFLQHGVIGHSVFHLLLACIPCHIPSAVLPTLGTSGTRELCVFANKGQQKQDQIELIKVDKHPPAVSLYLCLLSVSCKCGCHLFPQRKASPFLMRTFPFHILALGNGSDCQCYLHLRTPPRFITLFFVCLFSSRQRVVALRMCLKESFPPVVPIQNQSFQVFLFLLI